MARRRKSRAFGLGPATHAKQGAQAGRFERTAVQQAKMMAAHGNCTGAIHALVDAAKWDGFKDAHARSRSVSKRANWRYKGRLYTLTERVLKLCHVTHRGY